MKTQLINTSHCCALDILNELNAQLGKPETDSCYSDMVFANFYHPIRRQLLCDLMPEFAQKTIKVNKSIKVEDPVLRIKSPDLNTIDIKVIKGFCSDTITINSDNEYEVTYICDEEDVTKFSEDFICHVVDKLKSKKKILQGW